MALHCERCGSETPPASRFCSQCGAETGTPGAPPEGERRQATVMFSDLTSYTTLSERLDPEEVESAMSALKSQALQVVEAHGGIVNQFIGDEVVALFGIPLAHGDDARRAVRAAVALHASTRESIAELSRSAELALSFHTGIATGLVLTAQRDDREGRVGLTGDTVNLAARLRAAAGADEICVDGETRQQTVSDYGFEPLPTTQVKGKSRPVAMYRLSDTAPAQPRKTRFIGRRAESERFAAVSKRCAGSRRGEIVYLRGEAGIGKTRLVEAFARDAAAQGFKCVASRALDFGAGSGGDLIRTLARRLVEVGPDASDTERAHAATRALRSGRVSEAARPFLNDLLDVAQTGAAGRSYDAMAPTTRQEGVRETLCALVCSASEAGPLLVVAEDLHWSDPTALTHLAGLAAKITERPVLLVLTSRIEGDPIDAAWRRSAGATSFETLDVPPLGKGDAGGLAEAYRRARPEAVRACIERAAGNPLFLEQLLQHAEAERGEGIPGSIQSLVLWRLDRLPPRDKRALQAASVLGQRFTLDVLRTLLEQPDYECSEAVRHHLIRSDTEGFFFSHALVREGIYASLLRSRARTLHRKAADWFTSRDSSLRAQHLERAEDREAADAYLAAARDQLGAYRHDQALVSIERALELSPDQAARSGALLQKGAVLLELGSVPESIACYREALTAAPGATTRCRARIGIAGGLRIQDRPNDAFQVLEDAEREAGDEALLREQSELHHLRGNLHFPLGNLSECLDAHQKALDFAIRADSPEDEARARGGLGDAFHLSGRMQSAYESFCAAVELARAHGLGQIEVANVQMQAATLSLLDYRQHARALEIAAEAEALAEKVNAPRVSLLCATTIAFTRARFLEDMSGGVQAADRVMEIAAQIGAKRFEATALNSHGLIAFREGEPDRAIALFERALVIAKETGFGFTGPLILGCLARAERDPGKRRRILAEGEAAVAGGTAGLNWLLFFRDAIDVALEEGDWREAERYADTLDAYTRAEPWPYCEFVARRGRALAAFGRGRRDAELVTAIDAIKEECRSLGLWAPCFALVGE